MPTWVIWEKKKKETIKFKIVVEISSLCVVFVPLSVHLSATAAAGAGYPDFFFTNKCANSKNNTMHLSHPGCVHYPRSRCAKELEHWTSTVLYVLDATKTSQSSHSLSLFFLKIFSDCHQLRGERTLGHTNRINAITWANRLKIHNLAFSERDALSLTEPSPKYSLQHFSGLLGSSWYSASLGATMSDYPEGKCLGVVCRSAVAGSPVLHSRVQYYIMFLSSGVLENSWKCKALVSQTPPFCSTLSQ